EIRSVLFRSSLTDKRWDNYGALNISARLTLEGGGGTAVSLTNKAGGVVTDASPNNFPITYGSTATNKSFVNEGTFTKAVGSTDPQTIDVTFNNSGTLNVDTGTWQISAFGIDRGNYCIAT